MDEITSVNTQMDGVSARIKPKRVWNGGYKLIVAGLFIGVGSLAFVGGQMMVSPIFLSKVAAFCCLAGLLVPMKFYYKRLGIEKIEAFLLSVLGFGPIILSLLLWANYLIPIQTKTETYVVVKVELATDLDARFVYHLQDSLLTDFPEFREEIITPDIVHHQYAKSVTYIITTGVLGYDVVKDFVVNP